MIFLFLKFHRKNCWITDVDLWTCRREDGRARCTLRSRAATRLILPSIASGRSFQFWWRMVSLLSSRLKSYRIMNMDPWHFATHWQHCSKHRQMCQIVFKRYSKKRKGTANLSLIIVLECLWLCVCVPANAMNLIGWLRRRSSWKKRPLTALCLLTVLQHLRGKARKHDNMLIDSRADTVCT